MDMGAKKQTLKRRKVDNGRINLSKKELTFVLMEATAVTAVIAWIFYDSIYAFILFPASFYVCRLFFEKTKKAKADAIFDEQFKELLIAVSDALSGGYSVENAFLDAGESLKILYGKDAPILKDIKELNTKISMHIPAEVAFMEFANNNPSEEALGFAGVFSFAKRLGGGYLDNLRRTIEKMEEKLELKKDIRAAIAQKQMEFKIMSFMPLMVLGYVKLTSPDFLDNLYSDFAGLLIMTVCIAIYLVSILMGRRIVDIKV